MQKLNEPLNNLLSPNKTYKGVKLSKIRIIEKNTLYIIGLTATIADKSLMPKYEYFG